MKRRIILSFVFALLVIAPVLKSGGAGGAGTVYYVDTASSGGDGSTTATSGAHAAFATIAAVNAASFSAGDSVLFKRGCTWREQLTVPSSGSEGSVITFGAYGAGANPVIWSIYGNAKNYLTFTGLTVIGKWYLDGTNNTVDKCFEDGRTALNFITTGSTCANMKVIVTGSPTILWCWGDGTTSTSANPGTKNFGSAATRYNSFVVSDWSLVTAIGNGSDSTTIFNIGNLPSGLTGTLYLGSATALTGDIGSLPSGLTGILSLGAATALTGDIGSLPSGLTGSVYLSVATAITGNIGNLPSGLTGSVYLGAAIALTGDIGSLPSGLTGSLYLHASALTYNNATLPHRTGQTINIPGCGLSQTEVNNFLIKLDASGSTGGSLNISSNSAPSGDGITAKNNLIGKGMTVTTD